MSKLSELLNPAPSSEQASTNGQSIDGGGRNYHNRNPSLTSPLEALALAATSSPPTLSPTYTSIAPLASPTDHPHTFSNSSSRPSSSHFSLPMPHTLTHPPQPFTSSYDHSTQHHGDSNGRALSDIVDGGSRELPPLRRSIPNESDLGGTTATERGLLNGEQRDSSGDAQSHQLESLPKALSVEQDVHAGVHNSEKSLPHITTMNPSRVVDQPRRESPSSARAEVKLEVENGAVNSTDPSHNFSAAASKQTTTMTFPTQNSNDNDSRASVAEVKHENSTQDAMLDGQPSSPVKDTQSALQRSESKKRPAPKADKKKGTATTIKKPAAKKRKIDDGSMDGTPFSQRSGTPVSSRASKTPAPRNRKQGSSTPAQSSPPPSLKETEGQEDEDMDEDDSELFCICRKPDDHTWMIGCDGGCEDWFHGRCVGMNERDGNLIDKYICPNCKEKGVGQTTWKPMCRLESCREPARATGSNPSKYCSDEHGEQYMALRALGKDAKRNDPSKASSAKKRRKDNLTDHTANGNNDPPTRDEADDQAYLRGGVLRPPELKALTSGVTSLSEFKKLGEGVLSPPRTASPDITSPTDHQPKVVYTVEESTQLAEIATKKVDLKRKRSALDDREKFLGLVKARAKSVLEELKKREGAKDICGFDSRLSWSDEEFYAWRHSAEGKKALETDLLHLPVSSSLAKGDDGGDKMVNGDAEEIGKGICQKKRCERHKTWYKLQQQEIAFEKEEGRQAMRKLEEEEKGLNERAILRFLESSEGGEKRDAGNIAVDTSTESTQIREL